ncbi:MULTISPECIES: FadR/GntR family transcriptional regulator [unclassified Amycolatopsis]|uniref:FadR/GntR family transcriptional regulator n=1 Tax=unclassified Amycolatopsis TaxID=2618356 RepID=UPI001C699871|nr:FCD domain-containing protein [Amycolatopsis sp. DSM 110486]QYN18060.1 FCD domain-containing protein [Amycolatopsis sp. DSM 110486]
MSETAGTQAGLRVRRVQAAYRQVADQLKDQILTGELTAGTRLPNEAELARLFGVSRSTVREALRLLASQHLVDTTRGATGGTFVSSPDALSVAENLGGALGLLVNAQGMSVENLLEARLILEPLAARLAASRADAAGLETLAGATASTSALAPSSGFVVHWDFHTTLVAITGNPLLHLMCRPINDVLRGRLHRDRVPREVWDQVDADHVDIHRAVADGDADAAERLTREHLHSLRPLYEKMED